MPPAKKQFIDPEDLLTAEFEYIAQTAAQANEDRTSVVSFFLIAVGSPLAAFFSTDLISSNFENFNFALLFSGLFFVLTGLGTTTILQLARLRAAWYESMLAMNHMKQFLIEHSEYNVEKAFRWRTSTAPPKFKVNSISFYQALEVAILCGLLFGAFTFFLLQGLDGIIGSNQTIAMSVSVILGILSIRFHIGLYRRFLK